MEIVQKTEKAYFESTMDSIIDNDDGSNRRITQIIGLILFRKDAKKQNKRYFFSNYYHYFTVIKIVSFYFVFGLIGQIFRLLQNSKQPDSKNIDIVIINAPTVINRFEGISKTILIDYKTAEVFIYNEGFFKQYKGRKRTFLYPHFINIKTMKSIINYLINYRVAFYSNLVKYDAGIDLYTFREIDKYLIRQIIHYNWAEREAEALYCNYKKSIFFFDQDGDSKPLFLANHLNRKKVITIHIQHGIMTGSRFYIPICKYMFCCSEREKELLIAEGVAANRLFVYGVPFQNLIRGDRLLDNNDIKVKILVLASSSFDIFKINIAKEYIHLLKNSLILKGIEDKALRLRPGDRQIEKKLWESGLHDYKIRKNINIFEEIFNAEIIITY